MSTLSIIPPTTAAHTRQRLSSWRKYVPDCTENISTEDIAINHDHILYGK